MAKELKLARGTGSIEEAKLVSHVLLECEGGRVDQWQFQGAKFLCTPGMRDELASGSGMWVAGMAWCIAESWICASFCRGNSGKRT